MRRRVGFLPSALLLTGALVALSACSSSESSSSPSGEGTGAGTGAGGGSGGGGGTGGNRDASTEPLGPECTDGVKNGTETDLDCGGTCAPCKVQGKCGGDGDCEVGLWCVGNVCALPTATDKIKNGTETDVDCGGASAPKCGEGKGCLVADDCGEHVCNAGKCAPPSATDKVKNGTETDVDCGGASAPACADLKVCAAPTDCESKVCTGGICQVPTNTDEVQNGTETDVDCGGGGGAPLCIPTKKCAQGARDCDSKVCTGGICQVPTGSDGVQNGDESAVDCGGSTTNADRCPAGQTCNVDEDCASIGCNYAKRCAAGRSCTPRMGGDTCGTGEVGQGGAVHEDCCKRGTLSTGVEMDRYHVTAGRMRAFVEKTAGNVRAFAEGIPGWNVGSWSPLVPSTAAEANAMLGSYFHNAPNDTDGNQSKRSCEPGGFGGHTYFTPKNGGDYSDFSKDQLDVKALNCVGWHLAHAFCAWEGGRLPTRAEILDAFRNGNTTTYPWGNAAYNASQQDARLNHVFNYGYPNSGFPFGVRRTLAGGDAADIAWHVSPPGRFPTGVNAQKIEIMGNLLHWVGDGEYIFNWTSSWENHGASLSNQNWKNAWPGEPNGYYAIGFRCVYD